jgi:hypothetical protein
LLRSIANVDGSFTKCLGTRIASIVVHRVKR